MDTPQLVPIDTPRLHIRALTPDDAEAAFGVLGDPTTTADVSWGHDTIGATRQWLGRRLSDESERGMSMWAVQRRADQRIIGLCGPFPRGEDKLEIGYVIHAEHWGRGFGHEAVLAAVDQLTDAGHTLVATIRPQNTASIRIAENAGFKHVETYEDARGAMLRYETAAATASPTNNKPAD